MNTTKAKVAAFQASMDYLSHGKAEATGFSQLVAYAAQLAESWVNGNRSDVLEAILKQQPVVDRPVLALLVASYFDVDALHRPDSITVQLARDLHRWGG